MSRLQAHMHNFDAQLAQHLDDLQLKPQFYAFRWITLLLCQEFSLPDLIRLWDSLFAQRDRVEYLLLLCCSMLVNVKERLIDGDFATCLKLLQRYPMQDLLLIITTADKLLDRVGSGGYATSTIHLPTPTLIFFPPSSNTKRGTGNLSATVAEIDNSLTHGKERQRKRVETAA